MSSGSITAPADTNERHISHNQQRPQPGQHRFIKVKQADGTDKEIEQVFLRSGKWKKYTAKNTIDDKQVILAVKQEYKNFNKEGVFELQIRNMHYKLMERPELKLGEVADPYQTLDKIITDGREHQIKAERGEPIDKYWIPDEWWVDLKRHTPNERPYRTPEQHVKWLMQYHIKGWVAGFPQPFFYKQDEYYIAIFTEKDTMVALLEQLVANVFDGAEDVIPVTSVSGFTSRSHILKQIKRLRKHQLRGRKIVIFYLGDYDPSGLTIQKNIEKHFLEEGLTDYEIRRVGITFEQIKKLGLKEVRDPAKLKALAKDNNGAAFEKMPGHNGRRFAVEVDAMSSGQGLKELKKIIRGIRREFWDEETWNKYRDAFTSDKVYKRLIAAFVPYAREMVDNSYKPNQTIEEFAESLESEEDELKEIEGDNYREPIDPWDDDD